MKTRDVPHELRDFFKLFDQLCGKHDYSRVYDDYLSMAYTQFTPKCYPQYEQEHAAAMKPYNAKEKQIFSAMFREMIMVLHRQLGAPADAAWLDSKKDVKPRVSGWYDFFGDFYQELTSRGKSSRLGQFFTPPELCDLMTQINYPVPETGKTMCVHDPTCGSGRTLLSFNSFFPGHHHYAQDVDRMCCKMTLLNFAVHGVMGEVVWGDSLHPEDYREGWLVNVDINKPWKPLYGIPHIVPLVKEKSGIWQHWNQRREDVAAGRYVNGQYVDPPAAVPGRPRLTLFELPKPTQQPTPPPTPPSQERGVQKRPAAAVEIQQKLF
jgi:type I restriction enzyme M protein